MVILICFHIINFKLVHLMLIQDQNIQIQILLLLIFSEYNFSQSKLNTVFAFLNPDDYFFF